jgi:hypothetical protein
MDPTEHSPAMYASPSSAGAPTTTTTTTTTAAGSDPRVAAISYDHWASPAELVEMRSMWNDVLLQHRQQVGNLSAALKRVTEERDGLLREVRETQSLREMYHAARDQFSKVKEEQGRWEEERQALVLRLQKLQVESLDRNGSAAGGNKVALWGGGGAASSHVPGDAGSTGSTPSSGSSPGWSLVPTQQEIEYLESISRLQQQVWELEQRSSFQTMTDLLRTQKLDGKVQVLTAEIGLHQQRRGDLERLLTKKTAECSGLHEQLEHLQSISSRTQSEAKVLQTTMKLEIDRVKAECAAKLEDAKLTSDAKFQQSSAQLDLAMADAESTREKLSAALSYAQHAASRRHEQLQQLVEHLEAELSDEKETRRALELKLDDLSRKQSQQDQLYSETVRSLTASSSELVAVKAALVSRLDLSSAELGHAKAVHEKLLADLEKLMLDYRRASAENVELRSAVDVVPHLRQQIVALEAEMGVQREFFEKRVEQTTAAAEMAVQRAEEEVHAWMKEAAKWQKRCGQMLAKTADKRTSGAAAAHDGHHRGDRKTKASGSSTRDQPPLAPESKPSAEGAPIDALEVMKHSAKMAKDVQLTIAK